MASWQELPVVDLSTIKGWIEGIQDVLTGVAALLRVIAKILDIISTLLFALDNLLEALVAALLNALQQSITDLLQNNIALGFHLNMHYNTSWKLKRKKGDDPDEIVDYFNDGVPPFQGSGLEGWLLDILTSSNDPTDPFRPLADLDTTVTGVVILNGIPFNAEATELKAIFDAFTDFSDFGEWLDSQQEFFGTKEQIYDGNHAEIVETDVVEDLFVDFQAQGILPGDFFNLTDSNIAPNPGEFDRDFVIKKVLSPTQIQFEEEILAEQAFSDARWVIKRRVQQFLNPDKEALARLGPAMGNALLRESADATGKHNSVVGAYLAGLTRELRDDFTGRGLLPSLGSYPKWISIPLASLIPPIQVLFEILQRVIQSLIPSLGAADGLAKLADLLARRAELLADAIDQLNSLLTTLIGILEFIEGAWMIPITPSDVSAPVSSGQEISGTAGTKIVIDASGSSLFEETVRKKDLFEIPEYGPEIIAGSDAEGETDKFKVTLNGVDLEEAGVKVGDLFSGGPFSGLIPITEVKSSTEIKLEDPAPSDFEEEPWTIIRQSLFEVAKVIDPNTLELNKSLPLDAVDLPWVVSRTGGGLQGFISAAQAGDNKPDFGSTGLVAGIVAIQTRDDPTDHLQAFWDMIGISFEEFGADFTDRQEGIKESWDEISFDGEDP
jgi:hypothetical protein